MVQCNFFHLRASSKLFHETCFGSPPSKLFSCYALFYLQILHVFKVRSLRLCSLKTLGFSKIKVPWMVSVNPIERLNDTTEPRAHKKRWNKSGAKTFRAELNYIYRCWCLRRMQGKLTRKWNYFRPSYCCVVENCTVRASHFFALCIQGWNGCSDIR